MLASRSLKQLMGRWTQDLERAPSAASWGRRPVAWDRNRVTHASLGRPATTACHGQIMPISLLPNASSPTVVSALDDLRNGLTRISGHDAFATFNLYLRWSNDAAQRLGQLLPPSEVSSLVLTRRHWVLQGLDPTSNGGLASLVQLEIADRSRDLERAKTELIAAASRWNEFPGKLAVLDTNVYLHSANFLGLDWAGLLHAAEGEPIHLLVPMLVVDELDRAKRGNSRTAARAAIHWLDQTFAKAGSFDTSIASTSRRLTAHLLTDPSQHTRLSDADAELIDRCLALQLLVERKVNLLTFDVGMALRARSSGLAVERLDEGA